MPAHIVCPSGIYAITNTVNGKKYIGSALNIKTRWSFHNSMLRLGKHHSQKLQRSWVKHGADSFLFSVIEYVPNRLDLIAREQVWIDHFNAATKLGYNMRPTAESGLGLKQTPEHIALRCAAHIGAKRSQETRDKIRDASIGRKQSPEQIANRIAHIVGKKQTAEHIQKASVARIGRKNTPESIAKMKAVIKTDEARKNMSIAAMGKKLSPESIAKREATKTANRLAKLAS